MIIFAIDDEEDALSLLVNAIKSVAVDAKIYEFIKSADAMETDIIPDIVFTDIRMPEYSGIDIAHRFKKVNPNVNVIFSTGYGQHTKDAIRIHASGYIMKPPTRRKVKEEMDNLLFPIDFSQRGLYAQTFGSFEFFKDGIPINFKRKKCKELLALLIDKDGNRLNNEQIAYYLFEEEGYGIKIQGIVRNIVSDLKKSLMEIGIEDVLIKGYGTVAIDKSKFRCDCFDYWDGQPYAINRFKGEYLEDYSWAEESKAKFYWDKQRKDGDADED